MDKSTLAALVLGSVAFCAGVFRLVERFSHIAWFGSEEARGTKYEVPRETSAPHF
jgi:hypothetical protein